MIIAIVSLSIASARINQVQHLTICFEDWSECDRNFRRSTPSVGCMHLSAVVLESTSVFLWGLGLKCTSCLMSPAHQEAAQNHVDPYGPPLVILQTYRRPWQ